MELLQGTHDMLALRTLLLEPLHGYGIAKAIRNNSGEALDVEFGSHTAVGRKQLHREHSKWAGFVSAVGQVMGPIGEEGKS